MRTGRITAACCTTVSPTPYVVQRSIHSTAKTNADAELGKFISFDELYNNMFEEGLQARGQKAVDNAIRMARTYERDPKLAIRVVNVLFMICNISQTDKLIFPATIDNVTSLLVNNMETPRLTIKNEVEKIVETKMKDLNAASLEAAMSMIAGTCRSMGVEVEK